MIRRLLHRGLGKIVSAVLNVTFALLLIRSFPPEHYGVYAFAVAYVTMFAIVADLGLHLLTARELARDRAHASELIGTLAFLKIGFMWAAWFLMVVVFPMLGQGDGHVWVMVAVTGALLLADSAMEACQAVCHGFERMDLSSLLGIGYRLVIVGSGIGMLAWGGSIAQVIGVIAAAAWAAVAVSLLLLKRQLVPFRLAWQTDLAKRLVREGWPLALSGLFTALYFRVDTVLLARWALPQEVGWYGAAYKLYEMSMVLPAVVASVVLPAVAKASPQEARALSVKIFRWLGLGAIAVCVMGLTAAPWIVQFGLGGQYQASLGLLRVLLVAMPFMWIHHVGGAVVIALMGQRGLAWFTAGCAVLSVGAYVAWIPVGKAEAAAWVTAGTDVVLALGTMVLLKYRLTSPEQHAD